jgi:hypothetical protein
MARGHGSGGRVRYQRLSPVTDLEPRPADLPAPRRERWGNARIIRTPGPYGCTLIDLEKLGDEDTEGLGSLL